MLPSTLLTVLTCMCVVGMKASHYPSAPQYTWAPHLAMTPTQLPPQQYYKGQFTGPQYSSAPGFWNGGSAKGGSWNYNRLPLTGFSSGFYKNERADRPSYATGPSGFGTPPTTEGRISGKALAAGGYSRFTTSYQDPVQNRYGNFASFPQNSQTYGNYGGYRNVGFYGAKGPSFPNYPLPVGSSSQLQTANLQTFKGGRIYEGPVGGKYNQTKRTGVYVIPTPAKLYYDGVKN